MTFINPLNEKYILAAGRGGGGTSFSVSLMPQILQPRKRFKMKSNMQLALATGKSTFPHQFFFFFLLSRRVANGYLAASLQGTAPNHIRGNACPWDGGSRCK